MFKMKFAKKQQIKKKIETVSDVRSMLNKSDIAKTVAQKYGLGEIFHDIVDGVSITFEDLDVSAVTNNGKIVLNSKLLKSEEDIMEYLIHEFTHVCQHIVNDGNTEKIKSENKKKYLNRETELEAFQFQVKQIKKDDGVSEAESYVDQLLKHHKIKPGTKKWKTLHKLLSGDGEK